MNLLSAEYFPSLINVEKCFKVLASAACIVLQRAAKLQSELFYQTLFNKNNSQLRLYGEFRLLDVIEAYIATKTIDTCRLWAIKYPIRYAQIDVYQQRFLSGFSISQLTNLALYSTPCLFKNDVLQTS